MKKINIGAIKRLPVIVLLLTVFLSLAMAQVWAAPPATRIKDLAHVLEARDNQLVGFGLVVGLKNSGDTSQTGFTRQALTNMLSRMGMVPQGADFKSRNVAAVMVTCSLPPFARKGQKLNVMVSSVGDATSLQGGTLLQTPLQGADGLIYAVAQGSLIVGGDPIEPDVSPLGPKLTNNGRVPDGALVEKEVPVSMAEEGKLSIVISKPDFTTAKRIADVINARGYQAAAKDAAMVEVTLGQGVDLVNMIAQIENMKVIPGSMAKVVVNEQTGAVVIGEDVRISPVAVTYGDYRVVVGDMNIYSQTSDQPSDNQYLNTQTKAKVVRPPKQVVELKNAATLSDLVAALNGLGRQL